MAYLDGKRIVVTGSSRGLGRAFAERMAAEGARVVVNGTNADKVAEVELSIRASGATATSFVGSVGEESDVQALVATAMDAYGGIDVFVHNAGIVRDRTLLNMSADEFDDVVRVHLRGAFLCTKYAGAVMRDAGGGHLIYVISASGLSGGFGQGNYAAAKAGMMGLLRTAVLELPRFNIRCNALWPIAETDMTQVIFDKAQAAADQQGTAPPAPKDMGFGKPEEVASGMVWLASDLASHLNGQCVTFNGRRTGFWKHPSEVAIAFKDDPWQVEDLQSHFDGVDPEAVYRPPLVKAN